MKDKNITFSDNDNAAPVIQKADKLFSEELISELYKQFEPEIQRILVEELTNEEKKETEKQQKADKKNVPRNKTQRPSNIPDL